MPTFLRIQDFHKLLAAFGSTTLPPASATKKSNSQANRRMKSAVRNGTAIQRGDRILTEQPFVFVLQAKYRKERCDNCLQACKVLKCANCQYVYYCGRDCQTQCWRLHKIECPFLKRIYPRIVPDAARMLCKLIIHLDKGGDLVRGYYTETCSRRFRDMMSHYGEIKNDARRLEHLESLHGVLRDMMGENAIVPNLTELTSIYGRLITNGFSILDPEMNSIATAIYLGVSVTDHSCKPNAVATFEGTTLHVHAIDDIECLDWSKIFISYIDLLNTPEQRRAELQANYFFLCVCSKCTDVQETHEMLAAACGNKNCNEYLDINLNNCPRCDTGVSPKQRNGYNEAMAITKMHLENMKDVAYFDVCKLCLAKQKGFIHPLNIWHVKTLDAAFEAAIDVLKWREALEFGKELVVGFRKYLGDWHPLLGLLYLKIGKIQLYENYLPEAVNSLKEAQKILQVTHGRDHSLLREQLSPLLTQAVAESSYPIMPFENIFWL
ncbi:PREDICTED: histone-lysine N-methyltransferase SMYD3 isoform X1 [Rhagoletis zephyria]|uniref:histone-lysine N-methyltransferase SMYD3 isoform X1 n=1 Tax=Rhagoletis zephyria TaxID=28612 RepID=UPI000811605B|nr:PREDICTED: histone-lysine N-methyltransferase SMYD3 isoform X1 [Rhagoletis zephyria]XP_017470649.1 PREDICTED: histone-lysine N-methyltransferase SMYD3 isoform X1 [Rhagoletis zephyria]XP_017470650.1 PREDICTED: histone-lysine N-methyltransferase SMYD3 isoform X1 [Rhagoletis zephyria]